MLKPLEIFENWFKEATSSSMSEPGAMTLATVGSDGIPSSRIVLLKKVSERGFVFYTNLTSQKSQEISENPNVALLFYWPEISKQVRIVGIASKVGDVEADQYFATRPRQSQIGAWASRQSSVIEDRFELEKRLAKTAARFSVGPVPRPDFWSGFSVLPSRIEFWQKKAFRLHERHLFVRSEGAWIDQKLYP